MIPEPCPINKPPKNPSLEDILESDDLTILELWLLDIEAERNALWDVLLEVEICQEGKRELKRE